MLLANEVHTDNCIVVFHSILILNSMQKKKLINNRPQKLYTNVTNPRFRAGFGEAVRVTTVRWEICKVCNRIPFITFHVNEA